jgi:uncharacterized membrane protein
MSDPRLRRALALVLLVGSLIGWPATHVLIVVTHPPEASWVFHLLLALSWLALTLTALDILATTDVRVQHEEEDE